MKKKKILIIISAIIATMIFIAACSKTENKKSSNNEIKTENVANKEVQEVKEDSVDTKELNRKYTNSISKYMSEMGKNWRIISEICGTGINLYNSENIEKIETAIADIKSDWSQVFDVRTEETDEIKELQSKLKKVRELQEKSLDVFAVGIDTKDSQKLNESNKYSREATELINNDVVPYVEKMNK